MAPHSSTLAWKIPWTEELGRLLSMGSLRVGHDISDFTLTFSLSCFGEGNGNPLQWSCLENPRDRRAWWETVYGVTQCRTWLKWLRSSSSKKDDRLMSQTNHYIRVWMPGSSVEAERSNEELNSKGEWRGRGSGEIEWKGLSLAKCLWEWPASRTECVKLFTKVCKVRLSSPERNKGTSV